MANIDPGTGGTFKAVTVEGLIHEICAFLQIAESDPSKNPNAIDNIIGTHSQNQNRYSCNYSLPVIQTTNGTGNVEYSSAEYLVNLAFTLGTDGTFKSISVPGLLMEAIIYAQNIEAIPEKRLEGRDNITGRIDTDKKVFSGTIDIPTTSTIDANGSIVYTVVPFLAD